MAAAAAATSIALRCGGDRSFLCSKGRTAFGDRVMEGRCCPPQLRRSCSLVATKRWAARAVLAGPPVQQAAGSIAASTSVFVDRFAPRILVGADRPVRVKHQGEKDEGRGGGREPVSAEKLDEWMRDSVSEIVRNIGEAPFLVHVFSSNEGPAGLRLEREAADAESWPQIRRRWSRGAVLPPDGVILVEELSEGGEDGREGQAAAGGPSDDEDAASCSSSSVAPSSSSSSSKTWGLLVQGRGADGAACYILNTCRVRSSFGFCTHFCLARAKCFGDTADVQLRKAWLLGRKQHQQFSSSSK